MTAAREEHLSAAEQELQAELDLSWAKAQSDLADPTRRATIETALENINTAAPLLSRAEFLQLAQQ